MFTVNGTIEETNWEYVGGNAWHCSTSAATPECGQRFHIPLKGWSDIGWSFSCFVTAASDYLLTDREWLGSISVGVRRLVKRAVRRIRRAAFRLTAARQSSGCKCVRCFRL